MLKIRLTRTGKKTQESFRIVVADHHKAVQKQYLELLGHYIPTTNPKQFVIKKDRVEHWIKLGAKPTDTVASLLKRNGFSNMDQYIATKTKTAKKKKGEAAA